jgi:archaellum component FlaC
LSYQKELKALERLAKDEKIPDDLEMNINVYSSMLNKQPKYKKPKDEKKGKVNPYWEELNETVETAKRINTEYELMIGDAQMSLLHGVLKSDDF